MRQKVFWSLLLLTLGFVLAAVYVSPYFYIGVAIFGVLFMVAVYDMYQKKHSILRNFPLIGRTRYISEWLRPKIYQYFIESDLDGRPIPRIFRNIIYQRAKDTLDTQPFGTQLNTYEEGYEFINHSMQPTPQGEIEQMRYMIGARTCEQPYNASIYNISAMSFGSLSKNAVMAMNKGAKMGHFAHNTGEGGVSPYHLEHGGDLIFQFGTGYFGCRAKDGSFSNDIFQTTAKQPSIKMIEVKLSQGAKPGHGGILPGKKVTEEIAKIRNVEVGKDVLSPPYHTAFSDPEELMHFVARLRKLSGGKPVGIKFCVGAKSEVVALCKAMIATGEHPDFIAVDGGEGGTGAAPLEFANHIGSPMHEGLAFVYDCLIGFDLKSKVTLIAAGKVITAFDIFRAISLGADICYSARAMMMAIGCIQALECNKNTCPVGVATQDPSLQKAIIVEDKATRVKNFHEDTVHNFKEMVAAVGLRRIDDINRHHVSRRINATQVVGYDHIFPYISKGCLLEPSLIPKDWQKLISLASSKQFQPVFQEIYTE